MPVLQALCTRVCVLSMLSVDGAPQQRAPENINYHLKWAKALLASAILWVSSFFFIEGPSFRDASMSSFASRSAMVASDRCREKVVIQRIANAIRLSWRTSIGI